MQKTTAIKLIKEYLPYLKRTGQIIVICPQKKGYLSDSTHRTFYNRNDIAKIIEDLGLKITQKQSFPFPEKVGDFFKYNEYVVVGEKI